MIEHAMSVDPAAFDHFKEMCERPPEPNEKLRELMANRDLDNLELSTASRDYAAGHEHGFAEAATRINELLETNNRYLQEARDARSERDQFKHAMFRLVTQVPTAHDRCIVAAAIQYQGVVASAPRPGRHHTVGNAMARMFPAALEHEVEQGFLTNHGEFVGREQAYWIAKAAGQLPNDAQKPGYLFSEDLW